MLYIYLTCFLIYFITLSYHHHYLPITIYHWFNFDPLNFLLYFIFITPILFEIIFLLLILLTIIIINLNYPYHYFITVIMNDFHLTNDK